MLKVPNCNVQRGRVNGVHESGHNILDKIKRHEKSNKHIEASALYMKWKSGKVSDEENEKKIRRNSSFWVKDLHRLISIVLTLATLNLAFRGHHEHVSDNICEGGNFLGLVVLMAQYDETLADETLPTRATKYLSAKIQNELIQLLAKSVTSSLVQKINGAPLWSLILDSTSDVTRVDQLSVIVRWVNVTGEECTVVESFLGFIKVTDPNAARIASKAEKFIPDLGIDFNKLQGQEYDGASVMSGIHAAEQALVKKLVEAPVPFVHCGCYNLNLVINDAVNSVTENEKYFGVIKEVFHFFGSSLNRCDSEKAEPRKPLGQVPI